MRVRFAHVAALALLSTAALAESPRGNATATVAGKKVTIDYGRPSLKGRALADLLAKLSEDRVWRAGDDQVTTITAETDVEIGGKKLKAGKYSVYVHLPADGARNLVLNTDLGQPLIKLWDKAPADKANAPWPYIGNYQAKIAATEVLRVPMKKEATTAPVDSFTIDLGSAKDSANLKLSWGEESWSIDVKAAK